MQIRPVRPDELDAAADLLGRAFVGEPMLRWSHGGSDDDLAERIAAEFLLLDPFLIAHEMLWTVPDLLGVAAWIPPGDLAVQWQATSEANAEVNRGLADGGRHRDSMWEWVESRLPDEPQWFLDHVGVEPHARGQGIGRALIDFGLARADADGVTAALETGTAANVPYYERFGFVVVDEGDAPDGGPRIWFMRRAPLSPDAWA